MGLKINMAKDDRGNLIIERKSDYEDMHSYSVNGTKVYEFNKETGVLQMSISKKDLEFFLDGRTIPESGNLTLPLIIPGEYGTFRGVKKIESIPGHEDWEYLFKMKRKK